MLFDIEIGSVPASELPNLLNCLCKTVVNQQANIQNENGDDYLMSFDECVKNADSYKKILLKALHSLNRVKDTFRDITMIKTMLNNDIEESETIAKIIDDSTSNLAVSKAEIIVLCERMILKLLPISDVDVFKKWFSTNITDYIDVFTEFAEMPTA